MIARNPKWPVTPEKGIEVRLSQYLDAKAVRQQREDMFALHDRIVAADGAQVSAFRAWEWLSGPVYEAVRPHILPPARRKQMANFIQSRGGGGSMFAPACTRFKRFSGISAAWRVMFDSPYCPPVNLEEDIFGGINDFFGRLNYEHQKLMSLDKHPSISQMLADINMKIDGMYFKVTGSRPTQQIYTHDDWRQPRPDSLRGELWQLYLESLEAK